MKTEEHKRIMELLEFLLLDVGPEVFEDVFDSALKNHWLYRCTGCDEIVMPDDISRENDENECMDCIKESQHNDVWYRNKR